MSEMTKLAAERNRLLADEKQRLLGVLNKEVVPEGKVFGQNPNSLEHIRNVVDMVNLALHEGDDGASKLESRLEGARMFVSHLRESSAKYAESLILRDAERYLWARSGPTELPFGGLSKSKDFADLGNFIYNMGKEASLITGSDFMKANKKLPFSAMGGNFWWNLGREDWERFDSGSLEKRVQAHALTYDAVIKSQNDAAVGEDATDDYYSDPKNEPHPGKSKMSGPSLRKNYPLPDAIIGQRSAAQLGGQSFPPSHGGKGTVPAGVRKSYPLPPQIRPFQKMQAEIAGRQAFTAAGMAFQSQQIVQRQEAFQGTQAAQRAAFQGALAAQRAAFQAQQAVQTVPQFPPPPCFAPRPPMPPPPSPVFGAPVFVPPVPMPPPMVGPPPSPVFVPPLPQPGPVTINVPPPVSPPPQWFLGIGPMAQP
jgi:hypothetical protein